MRRCSISVVVGCVVLGGGILWGQTFRTDITAVVLDVIVTDGQGRPIPDLTKDDFEIIEDSQRRNVISATFVSLPIEGDRSLSQPLDVWTNRFSSNRRVFTIIIDDLDTAPRDAPRARDVVRRFISMMPDGDLAAIVFCGQQRGAQEFTADKARLLTKLEQFTGRRPEEKDEFGETADVGTAPSEQRMNLLRVLNTIQKVTDWLGGVEGRRKAVLFVTGAVTTSLMDISRDSRIADELRRVTTAAMLANVAIYPMDARGLAGPDDTATDATILQAFARETGGILTVNTNNLDRGFNTMVRDSSAYYLVGYSPGPEPDARKPVPHKIVVRTRRIGAVVRARQAYETGRTAAPSKLAGIARLLDSSLPGGRLPLEIQAASFADANGRARVFTILEISGGAVDFEPSKARQTASLTYAILASDVFGKILARDSRRLDFDLSDVRREEIAASRVRIVRSLELKPGSHRIRAAVVDEKRHEHGVAVGDLDVPNYAKAPVAMSGILLTSTGIRGPVRREDVRAFETHLAAPPTTQRTFGSGDGIAIYAEVYASSAAVALSRLTASIADARGRLLNEEHLRVESQNKGIAGAQCYAVRLPLRVRQLSQGTYTLTLTAGMAGATDAIAHVTFHIR